MRGKRSMKAPLLSGNGPLARVPAVAVFLVVAVVFAVGVVVRGVPGALLLGLLTVGVGMLLATTWQPLTPGQRAGRLLVLAVLIAVGISVLLAK